MFGIGLPELIVLGIVVGIPVAIFLGIRKGQVNAAGIDDTRQVVSNGRRLANFLVDIIVFRLAVFLLLVPVANTDFIQSLSKNSAADWLLGFCLLFLYYFVFETLFQRTPAKFITGTKVVVPDGSKPEAAVILKRSLFRLVPFEPLSGYKGTWWHDRWTMTRVVKT